MCTDRSHNMRRSSVAGILKSYKIHILYYAKCSDIIMYTYVCIVRAAVYLARSNVISDGNNIAIYLVFNNRIGIL